MFIKIFFGAVCSLSFSSIISAQEVGRNDKKANERWADIQLLIIDSVQDELGVNDPQAKDLQEFYKDARQRYAEAMSRMRSEGPNKNVMENFDRVVTEIEEELREILLPSQVSRLKQVANQFRYGRSAVTKFTMGLGSDKIADKLQLTGKQKNEVRNVAKDYKEELEELRAEFDKNTIKLRESHREKFLDVLSAEQREKYQELFGDLFYRSKKRL